MFFHPKADEPGARAYMHECLLSYTLKDIFEKIGMESSKIHGVASMCLFVGDLDPEFFHGMTHQHLKNHHEFMECIFG